MPVSGSGVHLMALPKHLRLEFVTPERTIAHDDVDEVQLPGEEGYFGVLPGHAALLATLGNGEVTYRQGREEHRVAVMGGFAEVLSDRVIILAECAERPDEIDRDRTERARQRAEQRLAGRSPGGAHEEIDYARARASLSRALARLQVVART